MSERNWTVSVVAPCFNEQEALPEFLSRVRAVCRELGNDYEIVLVDDGSRDRTWEIIATAALERDVLGVRLRRNHGHQLALSAGINASRGDLVLLIDADLQDPPELLPSMIEVMRAQQADVVYGHRRARAGETWFKRASASAFYAVLSWLADVELPRNSGDFRLISRVVADALCQMPERHRYVRGMIAWLGGRQIAFVYDRAERHGGVSKYPLRKMLGLATDALTGYSRRPLQLATVLGVICGALSGGLGLYAIAGWLWDVTLPGWTSLMVAMGFLSAMQFFLLGLLGEYIGRLYDEILQRPLFLEASRVGFGLSGAPSKAYSPGKHLGGRD